LQRQPRVKRDPIRPEELPGLTQAITAAGDVRILPFMGFEGENGFSGVDGFFIARLRVRN
jgi:16S rRNA (cytosine967-C5)-methyltransferase